MYHSSMPNSRQTTQTKPTQEVQTERPCLRKVGGGGGGGGSGGGGAGGGLVVVVLVLVVVLLLGVVVVVLLLLLGGGCGGGGCCYRPFLVLRDTSIDHSGSVGGLPLLGLLPSFLRDGGQSPFSALHK